MRSTLIRIFFLSSIFSQNILSLEYFGGDSLYVKSITESPIAGFQFELDNIAITNVNMPDSISAGFNISSNSNTVTGFSLTGATIPSGTNILSVVYFDILSGNGNICFDDECFQNTSNNGGTFYNCSLSNIGGAYLPIENYTTGLDYCVEGCFNESACNYLTTDSCEYPDANYNCDGSCVGDALEDECGTCDSDTSNDCVQDCVGVWGGTALIDVCGICDGGVEEVSNCTECPDSHPIDCNGECGGSLVDDECNVCGGDDSSCSDECGVPNGNNSSCSDECGVPNGDNTSCADCAGAPNGDAVADDCGICNGDDSSCAGCDGIPNSGIEEDACGNCGGDCIADNNGTIVCSPQLFNPDNEIIADCNGVCGGEEMSCVDCAGNIGGQVEVDCNGVCSGSAYIDSCESCVGGDTGVSQCLSIYENMPHEVSIMSTYPNPFNPSIHIEYSVASLGYVNLQIIGLDGRHINTMTNSIQTQGLYNVQWTPDNVPSGMYLVQLNANNQIQNKKIIYLK